MNALNCALQITKEMTTINEVIQKLEDWAPLSLQESYDNGGLIVGDGDQPLRGVLISLDCTEDIVDEAIKKNCNLIVSHHPIVFSGLKKLNGKNYIERTVIKAIQNHVAIYAIHTALDNVHTGVNQIIGQRLGVKDMKILRPKQNELLKLIVFTPQEYYEPLETALFSAGAGRIGNYDQCVFTTQGEGSFRPLPGANPHEGTIGERKKQDELRLEVLVPMHKKSKVNKAMQQAHPYEEVAHEWVKLENLHQEIGSGMIGFLESPMAVQDFLGYVKQKMGCTLVKHTKIHKDFIQKVAWCGGSGDFLLEDAIGQCADVYISADFKYHRFFDHNERIMICDIGHFETESCVIDLLNDWFTEKFTTFAIHKTEIVTNPVNYYF
jgi:dinuclear metal center YbgI/SA1388 family protein